MAVTARTDHAGAQASAAGKTASAPDALHWREIISQVGSEVGLPLSSALERVTQLATTGKIDRASLRALREEIERARRTGLIGQQLARFASGRIRQTPERLSLTQMLRDVLVQRGREAGTRHIELCQALKPAEVSADATVLHALLQALLDWTLDTARSRIELRLEIMTWPVRARLVCRFDHDAHESTPAPDTARVPHPAVDSMAWRLVEQIAWTLGLVIDREVRAAETTLSLEFPHTVTDELEGVSVVEIDQGFDVSGNSKPLAGSHVLVMVGNRDVRTLIKDAIRPMGLLVDYVSSVEEAAAFCRDALPHAIVYESVLASERFQRLRANILVEVPAFVFIEITAEGDTFELSTGANRQRARLGRDSIAPSLPTALIYELSRTL
jgi:hypothetical protein